MMSRLPEGRQRGFSLLELMTALVVIAVLAAVAVVGYRHYTDRARAVEVIGKFDAIRTGATLASRQAAGVAEDCGELVRTLDSANLPDQHVKLAYGFESVPGGWRPVLNVCAQAGQEGRVGVETARQTHDTMSRNGMVEKNALLTESVVSFGLRLTEGERPLCKNYRPLPASACAQAAPTTGGSGGGQPLTPQPVASQTAGPSSVASQPVRPQPVASQPVTPQPVASQPVPPRPVASQPGPGQGPARPVASQPVSPQGPGRPVTQTPPQGGRQPMDVNDLAASLMGHNELGFLNQRDQETVAATVAMMAMDPSYALVVKTAIGNTPSRNSVAIPSSPQNRTTIRFSGEMHRALEVLYPEAVRKACLANRPAGTNCG